MHITLARSLAILGVFTYSSTALVLQQTSAGFQNDLEPEANLHARNLGPFGQQGFNIATYLNSNPTHTESAVTSQIIAPVPSITADSSWKDKFLTPTTTITIPASTIYYTETTVTITPRGINTLAANSAMLQVTQAPPQTFHTITTSRSSALASSISRHEKEKRGWEEDKKACEALVQSEVLNCLESKGLLVPWTTVTEVLGGKTMLLVEVSVGAGRGRREARITGRV
ncbi:uncharacterized protein EAE97_001763 [Botrytis byssoidea]|uniref:Uncharacterized protein n=1 Tax=Botrytis byssoidea TaxID=139641 RepID=A0A9P5ISG7_9HELO|nr:uncharacterized protein EAE97_001763 [Botrytis byssoidea]KAF7952266.1 hypothetical protein EAE97_001763 [Botrytis byssoidea]